MEGDFRPADRISVDARKREWVRYYSKKRIHEQLMQVSLLEGLPVDTVLEIGPYYGLVTAMLDNAGYTVTTMDMMPRSFVRPDRPHRQMDLTRIEADKLRGFDCIMCCATLEHIHFHQAQAAVAAFRDSGARYVIISVPYQGIQLFFQLYANRHLVRRHLSFKKLRFLRRFRFDERANPHGHKWEVGYRGRALRHYEQMLRATGMTILKRDFSYPSYAVFHLLECAPGRTGARAPAGAAGVKKGLEISAANVHLSLDQSLLRRVLPVRRWRSTDHPASRDCPGVRG